MDALSFLTSALPLAWIRAPEPLSGGEQPSPRMGRAIAEGLRFVYGEPLLRSLTSSVGFVLGVLLAGWLTRRVGIGMTLTIAPLVIGGSDLLIPLAGLIPHLAFPLVGLVQFLWIVFSPVRTVRSAPQGPERLAESEAASQLVQPNIPSHGEPS